VTSLKRRSFLKGTAAGAVVTVAAASGMLQPTRVLAAQWPQDAFGADTMTDALKTLHGTDGPADNGDIQLIAPLQAENGAKVPVKVQTTLADVESIDILVSKNARPLAGHATFPNAHGFFSTRIKMAESSDVHAVVKAGGKLYQTKMTIKVTVGGCGG
jgi:sulfur-oxidizing protein SoxY